MTHTTDTPSLPRNLPAALRRAGLSQWQLSQRTGIHPSRVSLYCNGLRPPADHAERIAEALR